MHDGTAVNCQAEDITITAHNCAHEILTNYQWEPDGLTQPPLGGDGWLNTLRSITN